MSHSVNAYAVDSGLLSDAQLIWYNRPGSMQDVFNETLYVFLWLCTCFVLPICIGCILCLCQVGVFWKWWTACILSEPVMQWSCMCDRYQIEMGSNVETFGRLGTWLLWIICAVNSKEWIQSGSLIYDFYHMHVTQAMGRLHWCVSPVDCLTQTAITLHCNAMADDGRELHTPCTCCQDTFNPP